MCRICLEGEAEEKLISPCGCKGTQAMIHASCLNEWRRHEVARGSTRASQICATCGVAYSSMAGKAPRLIFASGREFGKVMAETVCGIGYFLCRTQPRSVGLLAFTAVCQAWARHLLLALVPFASIFIWMLYLKGLKMSVLGFGERMCLGITSFGPPVEGLSAGMLLISLTAGAPFRETVLLVLDHDDYGSLAVILNNRIARTPNGVQLHNGGPVQLGHLVIHNMPSAKGAQRLLRGEELFVTRDGDEAAGIARKTLEKGEWAVMFRGVSSWGPQQLEGEVRQGVWGWIRSAHVKPEDLLAIRSHEQLRLLWDQLRQSQRMDVFIE